MESYLNKLNIVFNGLLAGPLVFFFYAFIEKYNAQTQLVFEAGGYELKLSAFLFCAIIIYGSNRLKIQMALKAQKVVGLKEKLAKLLRLLLINYAVQEMGMFVMVLLYYLQGEVVYALFFVLLMVFYTLNRPTPNRIVMMLQLHSEERDIVLEKGELE